MASRGVSLAALCPACGKRGHTVDTCFRIHKCQICGKYGHLTSTCYQNLEYKSQQVFSQNRSLSSTGLSPECQICSKKGHTAAKCFYRTDVSADHPSLFIPTCQICGLKGHTATKCFYRNDVLADHPSLFIPKCQICGLKGHVALNCTHRTNFAYQRTEPPATLTDLTALSIGSLQQSQGVYFVPTGNSSDGVSNGGNLSSGSSSHFSGAQEQVELTGDQNISDNEVHEEINQQTVSAANVSIDGGDGLNSEDNGEENNRENDGDIDGLCSGDNDIGYLNDIDGNANADSVDSGVVSIVNADIDSVDVNSNVADLSNVVAGNESEETNLLQQLSEACLVVVALEASVSEALVNNFCSRELTSYEQIFEGAELAKLDKTERRYAWIKHRMRTTEEIWKIFPTSWHGSYRLCIQFCKKARKQLEGILNHQKEKPDVGALLLALQQIFEFEDELTKKFGSGTQDRVIGNEIEEIGRGDNTTQSASDIQKKCEKNLAAHQGNATEEKNKELSVLGAVFNFISSCFEPHLTVYTELEEKILMENLEKLVHDQQTVINLDYFSIVEEPVELGPEKLKEALASLGMKTGGTVQQRAERLFLTKDWWRWSNNYVSLAATQALYNALGFAQANFFNDKEHDFIMRVVCLVSISSTYYEKLSPYIQDIFSITAKAMKEDEEPITLQAIEFWSSICDEEIDILEEYEGEFTGDQDQDEGAWNIVMASGPCLGLVAQTVGDDVVPLVMPFLEENISKPDWRQREAATRAFGSVLEGPSPEKLMTLVNHVLSFMLNALMKDPNNHVYESLNEVVRCCTDETAQMVMQLVPLIMMELHQTLEGQRLSSNERDKQHDKDFNLMKETSRMNCKAFFVVGLPSYLFRLIPIVSISGWYPLLRLREGVKRTASCLVCDDVL